MILRALGDRIRDKRDELGMAGQDVAAAAGLPPGTVSKIENGRQNPTILTLARIAGALGCPLSELMPPPTPGPSTQAIIPPAPPK